MVFGVKPVIQKFVHLHTQFLCLCFFLDTESKTLTTASMDSTSACGDIQALTDLLCTVDVSSLANSQFKMYLPPLV